MRLKLNPVYKDTQFQDHCMQCPFERVVNLLYMKNMYQYQVSLLFYNILCGSRKYPYPPSPHGREWKFRGVGGVIGPGISGGEGGKGCCFDEFFSRPVSIFLLLYVMFRCLH